MTRKHRRCFRLPWPSDERGSMPMVMLVMLVGVTIGGLLVPMIVSQNRSTRFDNSRVISLGAAQAGIDAVVGRIRAAVAANGSGDSSLLPCATHTPDQPITGDANSTGPAAYQVYIDYYSSGTVTEPTGPMICAPGHGTFDPKSGRVTPSFAFLTSTGTDGPAVNGSSAGRILTTTYVFQTSNANISGGTIRVFSADNDTTNWCLDAGSATPSVGTALALRQCSTSVPLAPQQTFAYRNDLTIQLVSSVGSTVGGVTYANGLCFDAQNVTSTEPQENTLLVLKQCATVGSPIWSQQWSIDQHRSVQAPQKTSVATGTLSGLCLTVTLVTSGGKTVHAADSSVTLSDCTGTLTSPTDAWIPSPAIGAGAAVNANSGQWINFAQFGRCLNATANDVDAPYLTAPGCRQNPNSDADEYANQKITYDPATKQLYFTPNGPGTTKYCLYSLNKPNSTSLIDKRVVMTPCSTHPGVSTAQMQWTRTTPATDPSLPFSHQYRFQDLNQKCLSLADVPQMVPPPPSSDPGYSFWTSLWDDYKVWQKAVTVTCDYTTLQQWNASAIPSGSSLENTTEK